MKTIAVDAMGGDCAPAVEVQGAIAAARTGRVTVVLVGQQQRLERELRRAGARHLPITIRHADDVITMEDAPAAAVRRKRGASMRVAAELLSRREVDAMVSAGNSGAIVACGLFVLGRLPGVDRPGILTTFPTRTGEAVLIDMGANVECRPLHLLQYAVMGACYAQQALGRARPRIGVLANASEAHKGTELTRETDNALRSFASDAYEYAGYVEGRDVFRGVIDVVVCDGFSGNLVLKISEGAAETIYGIAKDALTRRVWSRLLVLPLLPVLRQVKRRIDYAEWGGAPLLGVRGPVIICHGGSNAKAMGNAILAAARHADRDLAGTIERAMEAHRELFARARTTVPDQGAGEGSGEGRKQHDTSDDRGDRPGGPGQGPEQCRSRADGRHQRRLDHRTDRHQETAHPRV